MNLFSPDAIYERGRKELAANQPQFRERFLHLISSGLAIYVHGDHNDWFACAPWSRLEGNVFFAYDLAREGEAGLMRIEFEQISFTQDTWGWLLVNEHPVLDFRPLSEADSQEFVDLWNARSGRPPVQLVEY